MKRPLLLILTLSLSLSSITSCSETNAQVNDAPSSWFNRKTLIATGALISSAALSAMVYITLSKLNQSFSQWLTNRLFPTKLEWKDIKINLQERTPTEMERMSAQEINALLRKEHKQPRSNIPLQLSQ